nr:laminin subunit beta-1-like [Crassostrea gigas]XP_034317840.1 laminin subunit beta-1-like [Crassostrea gigas]
MQCDRRTGQCVCLTGISGYKCDRCDRGTTGELPNCKPCGECFYNWDRVIRDLRDQTQYLVNGALKIKATGVEKAFEKEFAEMENNIQEIRDIIRNANVSSNDIRDIEMNLKQLRESLNISYTDLERTKDEIDVRSNSIRQGNNDIRALQMGVDKLKQKIENLKRNATNVQAQDVEGAFNLIKKAQEVSMAAQRKVDATDIILEQSETTTKEVNAMVESQHQEFDRKVAENSKNLKKVTDQINGLTDKITDINEMVCDKRGEPCHSVCGGGGCGVCGGEQSCGDGAVKKAENALDLARQAEELLKIKERNATELLQKLQNSQRGAEMGKDEAQMAYNEALKAKNQTEHACTALQDLFVRISGFLSADGATPNDIKSIAEEVLAMSISLTPNQILDLAQKINITIQGLQNIDDILAETSSDLARAKGLKDRAETAEADAKSILEKAEDVQANLKGATDAQQAAQVAIAQADKDIGDTEQDLTQIESETAAATDKSNQSLTSLGYLRARLQELKKKYIENEQRVDNAEMAAQEANKLALRAEEAANQLQNKYTTTTQDLNSRYNLTTQAQSRAETLRRRADKLATDTTAKLKKLRDMQENFNANEKRLNKLSTDIDELNRRMAEYLQAINDKATNYYNCKT